MKNSFSFKVGKMRAIPLDGGRFRVEADERKGKLVLERDNSGHGDHALHLKWIDRYTLRTEDDLILFPGDQTFEKVDTGRPNDRVYMLRFKAESSRRLFFWMQEAKKEKDSENCRLTNEYMRNPHLIGVDLTVDPNDPLQQSLLQLLQNLGPSQGNASARPNQGAPSLQVGDLSNILAGISGNAPASTGATSAPAGSTGASASQPTTAITGDVLKNALEKIPPIPKRTPPLEDVIRSQDIVPLLSDPEFSESLISLLPEGMQTPEELKDTFSSPQFRQALTALSEALQSDNFETVMASLSLNPSAGTDYIIRGDGVGAFLAAVLAQYKQAKQETAMEEDSGEKKEKYDLDKKGDDEDNADFYE